jgi:hypothetical protein
MQGLNILHVDIFESHATISISGKMCNNSLAEYFGMMEAMYKTFNITCTVC